MSPIQEMGKTLLIMGAIVAAVGISMMFADRIPFLGRLPGDIQIERENFSCSFPIVTSIVVSLLLTLVLNVLLRVFRR